MGEENVIVRFSSCQYHKVMELVLGMGSQAKPLAPESFVEDWKNEVKGMWEMVKEV